MQTGITCKKTFCFMYNSPCGWHIVENNEVILNIFDSSQRSEIYNLDWSI